MKVEVHNWQMLTEEEYMGGCIYYKYRDGIYTLWHARYTDVLAPKSWEFE